MSLKVSIMYPADLSGNTVAFNDWIMDENNNVDGYTKEEVLAIHNSEFVELVNQYLDHELEISFDNRVSIFTDEKEIFWNFFNGIPFSEDHEVIPGTPNPPGLVAALNEYEIITRPFCRLFTNVEVIRTVNGVVTNTLHNFTFPS